MYKFAKKVANHEGFTLVELIVVIAILGILAGIGLAELLGRAMQTPTAISVPAILVAALFSTVIGIVFGLLPATKAANMNPIDALRRE